MKDVATRAGVALKTVSRVVNGEPGVTPATAGRVLGVIEELGFRRNESARLLRTGRTATLGFLAEDTAEPDQAAVRAGLEDVVAERGFLLYAGSTGGDTAREERLALALCARRVDGMVIIPAQAPADHGYLRAEINAGVATVFALRPPALTGHDSAAGDGGTPLGDTVVIDEQGGAKAAVAHLIAQGHQRIGFLGGDQGGYRSRRLILGYTEAMSAAGLAADQAWTALTPDDLTGAGVTAVLCESRAYTAQALRALAARDGAPEIAVVGFGDFELADLMPQPITVIS